MHTDVGNKKEAVVLDELIKTEWGMLKDLKKMYARKGVTEICLLVLRKW